MFKHLLLKIILPAILLIVTIVSSVLAESEEMVTPQITKQYITEILAQPEFKTTQEKSYWQYIGGSSSAPEDIIPSSSSSLFSAELIGFIAEILELLLWLLLGIGILFIIIYGVRWLERQRSESFIKSTFIATPRLLDKKINHIQLPAHISQQAWLFWQAGDALAMLSLLYRGALSVLIASKGLTIDDSATESECLRVVKAKQAIELSNYFADLTQAWQKIAYARRQPSDVEAQRLCSEWQQHFG